jgi:hypothetical protein
MKKLIYLFLVFAFVFSACGKKNDSKKEEGTADKKKDESVANQQKKEDSLNALKD